MSATVFPTRLRWAKRQGFLSKLPTIEMPKKQKGMRGRPITTEEFERMLVTTPKAVGELAADSFRFYLRGLWTSGLRLEESLALRWDDGPGAIVVELGGRHPMLRIPAESEKGNVVKEFASTHDLRRSFGFRWSRRVMPTILRELMRHETIETTMQYYVGINAYELWRVR